MSCLRIHSIQKQLVLGVFLCIFVATSSGCAHRPAATVPAKGPNPDAKVLFIFVDSLRPDTVDDMVREGKLPNIKKFFYDQGLRLPNFYSSFPSLTVNAYGELLTGQWPDRTGLKAQSLFERYRTRRKGFWKRLFRINETFPKRANMLTDVEAAPNLLKRNGIKTLYDLLGEKFHPSIVPVSPTTAPMAWPHVAANDVEHPYHATVEATQKFDDINGKYAMQYMVSDTRGKLFMLWFMEMDEEQHHEEKGQRSDKTREKLIKIDEWLGKIHEGLVRENGGREIYLILFSDHGAYTGPGEVHNQPYHIARDFFYDTLKMNTRGPDYAVNHPGTDLDRYTYIDNMGRGQARIFLPVGDAQSGNWNRPNTLYELEHYGLGPNRKPVNLIRELLRIDLSARNKFPGQTDPHPVRFIFVKLAKDLVYILGQNGAAALLRIEENQSKLRYRYTPVRDVSQDAAGKLSWQEPAGADPFGYLTDPKFHAPDASKFLANFHDDREWLEATYETDFPEAVSALAHSFSWRPDLERLAPSEDPDICLSATPGWNFRIEDTNGVDHGAINRDAMRATLMLSGPNIRSGTDTKPHRLIDVTPTLFQLLGYDYSKTTHLDSEPIEGIYEKS
ncbi:MAG TPA: alkaline phosphatase family protein [Candidatus Omnitrophota bacterium]|nr:alkaline phosphatase family protein [Candidatus Omnitrophota bacterium]HPS37589.1 alkaline phosphatase family protein [Candidatus Omnitrophota bacterium]